MIRFFVCFVAKKKRTDVRDPERLIALSIVYGGEFFPWQARTPAVDEDVDPP